MGHSEENFSVDDILAELKGRSGGEKPELSDIDSLIDEILKEQTDKSSVKKETAEKSASASFYANAPEKEPLTSAAPPSSEPKPRFFGLEKETEPPMMKRMESRFPVEEPEASKSDDSTEKTPLFASQTYHTEQETPAPVSEDTSYLTLRENRQKKIKDFVLFGDEEEVSEQEEKAEVKSDTDEDRVIEEFDSMEDAPSVLSDLKELSASLSIRFVILLILFLLNLYMVGANLLSLPIPSLLNMAENPVFYTLSSAIMLGIAMIVAHTTIIGGLVKFFKLKSDGDSLPALTTLLCLAECVVFLLFPDELGKAGVHLYSFLAVAGLLFNCIGKIALVKRTQLNFKYVTSGCDKYVTTVIEDEHLANDLTKGVLNNIPVTASNKKTGFLSGFLDMSFREDIYDSLCRKLTPVVFVATLILTVSGYLLTRNAYIALTVATGALAVCSSLYGLLAVNLPLLQGVKRVHKHGGMIIGFPAVDEFSDVNSATAEGHDLFPAGSVVLHGIKTFQGMRIDDAILDAASILVEANSILSDIFMQVIQGKPELLKKVDTIVYEDMMGLSGWVDNKRVLIGSRELMLNHGIDVPSKDYEKRYCTEDNDIIYLSTSGELTAVFIVSLRPNPAAKDAVKRLESNDVFLIVKTVDSILTREKMARVYDVDPNLFRVIPARLHKAFDEQHKPSEKEEGFLANNGTFYSYIQTLITAKRLKARIMLGIVTLMASVIIGFGLITAFCLMNSMIKLNVLYLFGYQALWFVVSWIISKIRNL